MLIKTDTVEPCLSCFELTEYITKCRCKNSRVCHVCLKKWLKQRRYCMVCNDNLITYKIWVRKYRQIEKNNNNNNMNIDNNVEIQYLLTLNYFINLINNDQVLNPIDQSQVMKLVSNCLKIKTDL